MAVAAASHGSVVKMTNQKRQFLMLTIALALPATMAHAEPFAHSGTVSVAAERLFGLAYSSTTYERAGFEVTADVTQFSLLAGGTNLGPGRFSIPRIGIDYFPTDGFSLGTAGGFQTISIKGEARANTNGTSVSGDLSGDVTLFLIAPRVGYVVMLNDYLGVWARLGVTYAVTDVSDSRSDQSLFALSASVPLVFIPAPHVGFTLTPTLDLGLKGSTDIQNGGTSERADIKATALGIQAGLLAYF